MSVCTVTCNTGIRDLSESTAVAYAAAALRGDIQSCLGFGNGTSPNSIELRIDSAIGSFDVHVVDIHPDRIVITGSDELGLIHGIYAFSEKWLGTDPCRWFTGIVPEMTETIVIPVGSSKSKPYTFRHRGWFVNDEDLLVGFQMEKPEHGFSMEVWQSLLECALRNQCTCIIPGTNILSDEPQVKLASDMGLFIAQHHAEPLGSAPMFWPRGIPFSWTSNRADMITWWRKAIERQAGKKVLWTLNFRGLVDRPFWVDDPNLKPDAPAEAKAKIINEALAAQYDLIKEVRGEEHPEVYGYLWGELYSLYCAGLLKFPESTTIIHTDGGNGCMASNMEDMVRKSSHRTGVYQHISMFTGALSVRVTSYSPRTYARELKRSVDSGMTEILILNVGTIREKIFNLRQVMGYASDFKSMAAICGPDGEGYFDWYARHVLHATDVRVAQAYRDLTELPFKLHDEKPDSKFGDNIYTNIVRYSLQRLYNRENKPPAIFGLGGLSTFDEAMNWFIAKLGEVSPKWEIANERTKNLARYLQGAPLNFFDNEALAQLEKVMHLNNMALHFCRSAKLYLAGQGYPACQEAFQALRHCDAAQAVEKRIETGKFAGWHRNDLNCRTWKCHDFLTGWHTMLDQLRWMNLEGMAEGPQPCYAAYKYSPNFPTAYRPDLHLRTER
jgi:hypothetical protein